MFFLNLKMPDKQQDVLFIKIVELNSNWSNEYLIMTTIHLALLSIVNATLQNATFRSIL